MYVQVTDIERRIRVRNIRDQHVVPIVIDRFKFKKCALIGAKHLMKQDDFSIHLYKLEIAIFVQILCRLFLECPFLRPQNSHL
jgi:hypothetical protein